MICDLEGRKLVHIHDLYTECTFESEIIKFGVVACYMIMLFYVP